MQRYEILRRDIQEDQVCSSPHFRRSSPEYTRSQRFMYGKERSFHLIEIMIAKRHILVSKRKHNPSRKCPAAIPRPRKPRRKRAANRPSPRITRRKRAATRPSPRITCRKRAATRPSPRITCRKRAADRPSPRFVTTFLLFVTT